MVFTSMRLDEISYAGGSQLGGDFVSQETSAGSGGILVVTTGGGVLMASKG